MTTTMQRTGSGAGAANAPYIVVTSDSHTGPRLVEDLRQYCPKEYLDDFDAYASPMSTMLRFSDDEDQLVEQSRMMLRMFAGPEWDKADPEGAEIALHRLVRNMKTTGPFDMTQRLKDMDRDGVAAEVMFHGGGGGPMPFSDFRVGFAMPIPDNPEQLAVGYRMYNSWLADWIAGEPERHAALTYIPTWDIAAAVKEVEWGASVGLNGVNFPVPRGEVDYSDPEWDVLWSACETHDMALTTHAGATTIPAKGGIAAAMMIPFEMGGWANLRGLGQMVFGGVFERHPKLRLVFTEINGGWWPYTMRQLDSVYLSYKWQGDILSKLPSEYSAANVFHGASFMAPFEAEEAEREGFTGNVIWGSDYPHGEGTWQYAENLDDEPITRLSLRHCFANVRPEATRRMVGENGVRAYRLDGAKLAKVAEQIGAPTPDELSTPLAEMPDPFDVGRHSFRTMGPFH